jgi:hypothetical protein
MTCQLNPIFATYRVIVNGIPFVDPNPIDSQPALQNSNTTLIRDITATLVQAVFEGQSVIGNTFIDAAQSIALSNSGISEKQSVPAMAQAMFQGMFEISGLAINGYWSSKVFQNTTSSALLQSPYIRAVEGRLKVGLYGWKGNASAAAGLIPVTIAAIISLSLLVWTFRGHSEMPPIAFNSSSE